MRMSFAFSMISRSTSTFIQMKPHSSRSRVPSSGCQGPLTEPFHLQSGTWNLAHGTPLHHPSLQQVMQMDDPLRPPPHIDDQQGGDRVPLHPLQGLGSQGIFLDNLGVGGHTLLNPSL